MYGAIIGDIAGSTYEFSPVKEKGVPFFAAGSMPTDDSVMTVAVAEALLLCPKGATDEEIKVMLVKCMQAWGRRYPEGDYGGRFIHWIFSENPQPYNSYGNGSAMRVSPVGWLYDDMKTTRKMARLSAEVTHNHPEGIKGAEATAAAIFLAKSGSTKEEIRRYIEENFAYDLQRSCDEIRPDYHFDETCQGSVPEAIIAFLDGEDYRDAVCNAISLGGDADTQGAIAGSIAEPFFGIPDDLIEKCNGHLPQDMKAVVEDFYRQI